MTQDDEFFRTLRHAFDAEADEHLQAISAGLLEMEQHPDAERGSQIVAAIFREAHSLKGAARAVNASEIEVICQALESVFSEWRRQNVDAVVEVLDPLHRAVSAINGLLSVPSGGGTTLSNKEVEDLLVQLAALSAPMNPSAPADTAPDNTEPADAEAATNPAGAMPSGNVGLPAGGAVPSAAAHSLPETLRISTAKLDAVLLKAEELLAVKMTSAQQYSELKGLVGMLTGYDKECGKLSDATRTLHLAGAEGVSGNDPQAALTPATAARLAEFVDWNQALVCSLRDRLEALAKSADRDRRAAAAMVDTLLEDAKKLLMLPFSTLLAVFPKLVRDLSRDEGKDVELVIQGSEVEIDKRILEEMKDPLIHLVRNCIDHGIEKPARRAELGKPPRGRISISIMQVEGSKVEIRVSDDGAGIDPQAVKRAALRQQIISPAEEKNLNELEATWLVFRPELSTSPLITEISGRGLGLAIVKEKTEKLGGRIELDSRRGSGTSFRLLLPLALATFRGILVRAADQVFVVPTASVERVARIRRDSIKTVENRETITLDNLTVSLVRLADILQLRPEPDVEGAGYLSVAVLGAAEKRIAFIVDAVQNEQEVLVKPLAKPLSRVRNVAGATVLGSGKAVLILNVSDLLKSAAKWAPAAAVALSSPVPQSQRKSILVVEDSITARMLIKNILESAGYAVKTAVDGVDALSTLGADNFDLVVSDVEMPRLNGFALTERIRADKRLGQLPVVLVTALASPEDRERGVDVGASAYIVKSSFDQSNLLEVVRRLV